MSNRGSLDRLEPNKVSGGDLAALLRARPGLIIGPSWCYGKDTLAGLSEQFSSVEPPRPDLPYHEAITDSLRSGACDQAEVDRRVKAYFNKKVLARVHKTAKLRWSAVAKCPSVHSGCAPRS